MMNGSAIEVNGRRYAAPKQPTVVFCIDGCEPDYISQAVAGGHMPHLKRVLSEGGIDVNVVFGPARTLSASDNRKAATQQAGELVRKLVAAVNGGRDPADVLVAAESEAALTLQARRRENRPAEAAE